MSWAEAQKEAEKWMSTLPLPKNYRGQTLDFREHVKTLKFEGHFRRMVLRATIRQITKKGGDWNITEYE